MAGKKNKKLGVSDEKINWLECDKCGRWEIYENSGAKVEYSKEVAEQMEFECSFCELSENIKQRDNKIKGLENRIKDLEAELNQVKMGTAMNEKFGLIELQLAEVIDHVRNVDKKCENKVDKIDLVSQEKENEYAMIVKRGYVSRVGSKIKERPYNPEKNEIELKNKFEILNLIDLRWKRCRIK